jgi:hypothetical protein
MPWSFAVPKGSVETFDARVRAAAKADRDRSSEVELDAAVKAAQDAKDANENEAVTVTVRDV